MGNVVQYDIDELLERAGAQPRGNGRFDCPDCGGCRTVSTCGPHPDTFRCHHASCDFHGGIGTLKKRLGIGREWLTYEEYRRQKIEREKAHEAAMRLYAVAHERELKLRERIRMLGQLELAAHDLGPRLPETWEVLAGVYAERPVIEESLDRLESGDVEVIYSEVRRSKGS